MQPDYSQLWRNINNDGQDSDSHFYTFFEDSLNQFISTNSGSNQSVANKSFKEPKDYSDNETEHGNFISNKQ